MNKKFLEITFNYFKRIPLGHECPRESPKHLTDFLISSIISSSKLGLGKSEICEQVKHVYNASQLIEAGLEFNVSPNKSILDLTYENGVLTMPILNIHDVTEVLFRNMMTYEDCHYSATKIISQYVVILDFLINTEKDVDILIDKKIIINWMSDANKVVTMINNLMSIYDFYENPCNKYMATFRH